MQELSQSEDLLVRELFERSRKECDEEFGPIKKVEKLSGDASSRKYYRIFSKASSYVISIDSPENLTKADFNFITTQKIFSENNVRVPKIFHVITNRGYTLQEDLGDQTLLLENVSLTGSDEEYKLYERVCDQLLKINLIPPSKYESESLVRNRFDFEKLMWEVRFTNKYFIEQHLERAIPETVERHFQDIVNKITEEEYCVVHRDFHSRNVMMVDGEVVIIDFQDARLGPPQYDLCSLLEDAYYKISKAAKEKLIKSYYEKLVSNGLYSKSEKEFKSFYNLVSIQRTYKAMGTFCYIFHERGDARYLKYIHSCFENLKRKLWELEEYNELRQTLSKFYYAS
ncbi:MAG: aminoglycoside phosphotransferase family protein [Bacteriovoracaceae bacterium]